MLFRLSAVTSFRFFLHASLAGLLSYSAAQAQLSIKANSTNLLDKRFAAATTTVANGEVTAITVINGGSGYTLGPAVTISAPPSGNTATATATVSGGFLTAITITSGGSGYTTAPTISIAPPPAYNPSGTPAVTTSQYAGQANSSASSGPINATELDQSIPDFAAGRYPRGYDKTNAATPVTTVVLGSSSFGYSFASGVPRYSFGDEIPRPTVNWKGDAVAETYWRVEPITPGESFAPAGPSNLGALGSGNVPLSAGTVTVNSSTAGSANVTVASVPDNLTPGATLLGKKVAYISGTIVTLMTPASITTSSAIEVSFTPRQTYYYSRHAQRVFASQPGRVTITWVSNLPDTSATGETVASYKFRQETFSVASSSQVPVRTIYWTGNGFSAPAVEIPSGRITVVNPIYNTFVPPGVANAYTPVGANPGNMTMPEEHRTLWFDQVGTSKSLNAHNIEGILMVEYLGVEVGNGARVFLGADVVQIKSEPEVVTVTTSLGDELLPREGGPVSGDEFLKPAVSITDSQARLGSYQTSDGVAHYFAEKENLDPDQVQITWMEETDASIYFLTAPATPNLSIHWPKRRCAYLLKWPDGLADYVAVNVQDTGNTAVNAIQFDPSTLPENKFQDCAPNVETEVDPATQRLLVDFSQSTDKTNRTLLKFDSADGLWYQRLYIQADSLLGLPAVEDPDGSGPQPGSPAVYTINDTNGDGINDTILTATVGSRLTPPAGCELAGYVAGGTCYSADAYANPFEVGFPSAAAKAIIPVNAAPGANTLKVWWSKKITPPSPKLKPFYVPSVAATYTVSYPASPQELVIASGKGLENPALTSEQAAGSVYVQNDSSLIGYNPNEEHALMIGGNVYALRDDLNDTATASYSSEPYLLVAYHEALTGRPAMRVAKVIRSNATYPLEWNKAAGTPVQAPMPLALLPLPLTDENDPYSVKNVEVVGVVDEASNTNAPTGTSVPVNYDSFTFVDRKGMHWLYRGPHTPSSATASASLEADKVSNLLLTEPGSYYASAPVVTLSAPPSGITATATATVFDGAVTGFTITEEGSGYTASPTVTIAAPLTQPSYGMRYYYKSLPGFFIPSLPLESQPPVGTVMPYVAADTNENKVSGLATTLTYYPKWPDDAIFGEQAATLPELQTAQTLTLPTSGLPQVRGQTSAQVAYQQSIANTVANLGTTLASVVLSDPTRRKTYALGAGGLATIPASVLTTQSSGRTYFQGLPPDLQNRFYFDPNLGTSGALVLIGEFIDVPAGEDYLNLNALSVAEVSLVEDLCPASDSSNRSEWEIAIDSLVTQLETFSESTTVPGAYVVDASKDSRSLGPLLLPNIEDPDTAVDSYALSSTGGGTGYVTLVFGNGEAFTDTGDPVVMQIIKVSPDLYPGDLKVLLSSNPLDEQVTLRHSGDYGAKPENFEFEWRYGFPVEGVYPGLDEISTSIGSSNWLKPDGTLGSSILVGGTPTAVLSDPAILMGDCYFTMAYRKKAIDSLPAGDWSAWTSPVLVEGWIKRVLAKITPFNQRMTDLSNSVINTDISMLTQAGTRWEGDIALNLDNINDVGLIAIYETILNRGKSFTVGNDIDFSTTNDALLLAAGYLNDLYMILGNEAYADAANPTISIDDQATATEVNTSRFSFEGQVASSLDEELGLLRGRDDFTSPGTAVAPAHNRLYWNYTRGINSGEALYATNYNIKEKTGSPSANGILDAADAQRMFPQGHGDAYGHYLTAVTNYYKLLTHPYFTWTPRAEGVTVLGQTVLVDYMDERKFAAAAANVATTAQQILALVHRKSYSDERSIGWTNLRDSGTNPSTNETRDWGLDEWTSRSAQGSFFHWVTGNSLLLSDDNVNSGVQKIDRSTVPELDQLVMAGVSFQTTLDNANAHLNPLGLSPNAIAFDISPSELNNGKSHYEQIEDRALGAVINAKGAFNQAAKMTRLLRSQDNQTSVQNTAIVEQENTYSNLLMEIFGQPYAGDLGPGKTYSQDYSGPDLLNWSIIDRPSTILVDTTKQVSITLRVPTANPSFGALSLEEIQANYDGSSSISVTEEKSFNVLPNQYAQYADLVSPGVSLGSRPQTGTLQQTLLDAESARAALIEANYKLQSLQSSFDRKGQQVLGILEANLQSVETQSQFSANMEKASLAAANLRRVADVMTAVKDVSEQAADAYAEALPKVIGLANDATSAARGGLKFGSVSLQSVYTGTITASNFSADLLEGAIEQLSRFETANLAAIEFDKEEEQTAYEFDVLSKDLLSEVYQVNELMTQMLVADQQVKNQLVAGLTVMTERESFRQRAAAVVSGYRTNDLTFRTFRNEALEQYRSLFDLASRYTYLAAKSYDYETGLLGTPQGQAVISRIVAARSLGDLTGDVPQATASTLGDAGLAGTIAQMNADFSVVKGRLGINNPDQYGTLFSLRSELYRLGTTTADSDAWQQTLEQSIQANVMSDPDVVRYCNNLSKPDGSAVPGFIIPFSSTIQHAKNFFGLPTAVGDHAYSPGSYSTKISSAGIVLMGYVGMDPFTDGTPGAGGPNLTDPNSLSATPYLYLIPCGEDSMLAPPLGDTNTLRSWTVHDQALPLPFNLGASAFNTTQFFNAAGTLSEQPWIQRKHQGFRPVSDPVFFYSRVPAEFTNSRLVGRSVWNSKWKIVIPAYMLLADEQEGLTRFAASVSDIKLFLRTYSNSGN